MEITSCSVQIFVVIWKWNMKYTCSIVFACLLGVGGVGGIMATTTVWLLEVSWIQKEDAKEKTSKLFRNSSTFFTPTFLGLGTPTLIIFAKLLLSYCTFSHKYHNF